jgi:hypothetical protein
MKFTSYAFSAFLGLLADISVLYIVRSHSSASVASAQLISGLIGALLLYTLESRSIQNRFRFVPLWFGYQGIWIICQARLIQYIFSLTNILLLAKIVVSGTSLVVGFLFLRILLKLSSLLAKGK